MEGLSWCIVMGGPASLVSTHQMLAVVPAVAANSISKHCQTPFGAKRWLSLAEPAVIL